MNELLLGLLSALLATNQVVAASNAVARTTGIALPVVDPADPVEREYQQLLERDDDAQTEVEEWIQAVEVKGDATAQLTLRPRIQQRFETVETAYVDFLRRHPGHTRARLAFGSLLGDLGRYDEAVAQWEKARELEPSNPVAWNNLGDHFSHFGPVRKCLEYFAKSVELAPKEPLYRYNLASAVAAFRADAREYYGLADDQAVLRKALVLYGEARVLSPNDLRVATDLAQMYYLLQPAVPSGADAGERARVTKAFVAEGVRAWQDAEKVAHNDVERQGVAVHLARFLGMHGQFGEARQQLARVTEPGLAELKSRLLRSMADKEKKAGEKGASPADGGAKATVPSAPGSGSGAVPRDVP